jgi:hypothetical protein
MKKIITLVFAFFAVLGTQAQTLNVVQGEVTYAHAAAQVGDMPYAGGTTLTIQGKAYTISDIDKITIDNSSVADNTVSVTYNGASAAVVVAGNVAQYLTVTASGAAVSITQAATLPNEIIYTLSGTSTDGSFYMNGELKAIVALNGLTLSSTKGAPIDIENGKRIALTLTGTNTLSDVAGGTQNACLYVNGHTEVSGTGTLTITGNTKHGFTSDEYLQIKSGTLKVTAVDDGLHVGQYFRMDNGTVTVNSVGDGVDVGAKTKSYDYNGQMFINGGTITVTTTGNMSKGLKCDSTMTVNGGTMNITVSGNAAYDTAAAEISGCAAVKPGGAFTMTSGSLTTLCTGDGGKGINATKDITISGGTIDITTTGSPFVYGADDTKPQGIKTDANINISGGQIYVAASEDGGTAFKTDYLFNVTGGTFMGIGGKKGVPTSATQVYKYYKDIAITKGTTVSYDGVSHSFPNAASYTAAKVVVSSPTMK